VGIETAGSQENTVTQMQRAHFMRVQMRLRHVDIGQMPDSLDLLFEQGTRSPYGKPHAPETGAAGELLNGLHGNVGCVAPPFEGADHQDIPGTVGVFWVKSVKSFMNVIWNYMKIFNIRITVNAGNAFYKI